METATPGESEHHERSGVRGFLKIYNKILALISSHKKAKFKWFSL